METMKNINAFPGYEYVDGQNMYRGVNLGRGGYIISTPGIYTNVALLDVASLHPHSILAMNCFGEYTKNFKDLVDARIAIKHGDYETARKMLDGKLSPYLDDENNAKDLAQALKIAINSVYGLTAANFDNPFRDVRNKNNIVALRGALFMKTLQDEVESKGYSIVAIKTDSIKIADADSEIINFCMDFAKNYAYTFEHEATYEKMCQINDADYIAKLADKDWCNEKYGYIPSDNIKKSGKWTATGDRFSEPYVFKTLFTYDGVEFKDLCVTNSVSTSLYLDFNEGKYAKILERYGIGGVPATKCLDDDTMKTYLRSIKMRRDDINAVLKDPANHDYRFVGRVGSFCPVIQGSGGGLLMREKSDGGFGNANGGKGYRWMESETVLKRNLTSQIDMSYFEKMAYDAREAISEYGDFTWFAS